MDTLLYAQKNCKLCKGKGRVKVGEGIGDWAVCPCATLGQRRATAERILEDRFPSRLRGMTLANFKTGDSPHNEEALTVARNFVENFAKAQENGWVLGFWGEPNTGKTHLAVAIAQALTKRYLARPILANVPDLLQGERERFNNPEAASPIQRAIEADILILDDLGAQYEKGGGDQMSWVMDRLYHLLDQRYTHNRPTIYTTNFTPSDLARRMSTESSARVLSRLQRAEPIEPLEIEPVDEVRAKSVSDAKLLFGK